MQTFKFSRLMTLVTVFVVALLAAACSPSSTTPTSAPGGETNATTVPSGSGETAGDPAAAAKAFFDALLTGGDPSSFVCTTGADAQAIQDGFKQMASAYAAAKIDTANLTYTASDVTADTANVAVGGTFSMDTSGVKTDVPFEIPKVVMKNESGSWKICG